MLKRSLGNRSSQADAPRQVQGVHLVGPAAGVQPWGMVFRRSQMAPNLSPTPGALTLPVH